MEDGALDVREPKSDGGAAIAEKLLDTTARARDAVWGHRVTHPKGIVLTGTFTATDQAKKLSRAAYLQGDPVRVTVRFSNGSSTPDNHDASVGDARGIGVKFYLPDGKKTDLLGQAWPAFPSRTPEEFLELMQAQVDGPEAIGAFIDKYPQYVPILQAIDSVPPPVSWATVGFNSINAFWLVDAEGQRRAVRFRFEPEAGEQALPEDERDSADHDYLINGIADILPIRYRLRAQLAGEGDDVNDSTVAWPADREWVDLGVIEITGPDTEREKNGDILVNDPMRLVDGIEPTDDPILHVRTHVYARSVLRRGGGPRPDVLA